MSFIGWWIAHALLSKSSSSSLEYENYLKEKEKERNASLNNQLNQEKELYVKDQEEFLKKHKIVKEAFMKKYDNTLANSFDFRTKAIEILSNKEINKEEVKKIFSSISSEWTFNSDSFYYEISVFLEVLEYFYFKSFDKEISDKQLERFVCYKNNIPNNNNISYIMLSENNYNLYQKRGDKFAFVVVDRIIKYFLSIWYLIENTTNNKDFCYFVPNIPFTYWGKPVPWVKVYKRMDYFISMKIIKDFYDFFKKNI